MKRTILTLTLALFALISHAQRTAFMAKTSGFGQLKSVLGEKANEIDSLVVEGPINAADFGTMWECAFYGNLHAINLSKAEIEDGRIPDRALYRVEEQQLSEYVYTALEIRDIVLPEGITAIGDYAFKSCGLENINLPESLRRLGKSCFNRCDRLKTSPFVIPEGIEEIPDYCFQACQSLTEVRLPESLKKIGYSAFEEAWNLNCNFPDALQNISDHAFSGVIGLTSVRLPKDCKLGFASFAYCRNVRQLVLPENLTVIPDYFMDSCVALEELEIPSGVTRIGNDAFYNGGFHAVTLPDGLKQIGEEAFAFCKLDSVIIPASVSYLGGRSFDRCLKKAYVLSATPPDCGTFYGAGPIVPFDIPVYVPKGTAHLYRAAPGWNMMTNIIEMEDSLITGITPESLSNPPRQGIFNLQGQRLSSEPEKGVYIINGKKMIKK